MNTGMLWFDNDPKADFNTKINRATDYYLKIWAASRPVLCAPEHEVRTTSKDSGS